MEHLYLGIVIFLFMLSAFDLSVGVSNDAVNFLSSAIGSKTAKLRTIMIVAAIGVFVGATTSNGMMDIARHGIFRPEHFYFSEVMCVFLAVVASDVILLDLFNLLGLPTSTTVSMVFELLGGSTALAMLKIIENPEHKYAELINTDKALSVILAIFLSVAIAFVFGLIVQWLARVLFTFHYKKNLKYTIGIFGGIALTSISFFLLTKGFGKSSVMTPDAREWIANNTGTIIIACLLGFSVAMQFLHVLKVNVFRIIVLFGTFSLAMAFAGNDLVNFIGVTLAGFSSYQYYMEAGGGDPDAFNMDPLNGPATTPTYFLIIAGAIMIFALITSKKAQNVVKTSVDLSRQTAGEELFGSSRLARSIVRGVLNANEGMRRVLPAPMLNWINNRFNTSVSDMPVGAAFDQVRASVNLVLAGLLIVIGTSMQLPLSTTYVAFMVGMGTSLADRAWGRESAVFRVTGVISVVGGWFLTAGAAFFLCFTVTIILYFGGFIAMALLIALVIFMLIRNNMTYKKKQAKIVDDVIFKQLIVCNEPEKAWPLLRQHVSEAQVRFIEFIRDNYMLITDGLMRDDVKSLRKALYGLADEKKQWKVNRRKEILGMRRIDPMLTVKKNTWFHLGNSSSEQCLYGLKRMCEPCLEHVDNNFNPMPEHYAAEFGPIRKEVEAMLNNMLEIIRTDNDEMADQLRDQGKEMKHKLSELRRNQQERVGTEEGNLQIGLLYLSALQETQELISNIRHLMRASIRFQE